MTLSLAQSVVLTLLLLNFIVAVVCAAPKGPSVNKQVKAVPIFKPTRFLHSCQCCVCFALDESGSISSTEWATQVNFVLSLAQLHNSYNGGRARYSAVAFESSPPSTLITDLTSSYAYFALKLNNYVRNSGGTNIGAGLERCQKTLIANRWCQGRTIVLLTDGFGSAPPATVDAIKTSGTSIITVGIGSSVNFPQLQAIASEPSCAFRTAFSALSAIPKAPETEEPIAATVCVNSLLTRITTKFCRRKAYILHTLSPVPVDTKRTA